VSAAPVSFQQVTCRYGRRTVVDSVCLDVAAGEHVVLTGANGSGKTTLLRAALGLHPLAGGAVTLAGAAAGQVDDPRRDRKVRQREWTVRRREIAWVPQKLAPGHFPLLVDELLDSGGHPDSAREAADVLGVGGLGPRPLHTLSGGQLQRAFLARALGAVAAGARALFADEPTAALDFDGQEQVATLLARLPVTVVVVSHDRAMARASDRVAEMAAGRLRMV
jgi:zinc transport system ATP-binding protein